MDEVIEKGELKIMEDGKISIWYNKIRIILLLDFNGEKLNFIVTAFKQRKK
jgi:hypothetical protein